MIQSERNEYDIGLSRFLKSVYISTGYSLLTSVVTAQILSCVSPQFLSVILLVGAIGCIISCFVFNKIETERKTEELNNQTIYYCIDPTSRKCAFYSLSFFIGIILTPLVVIMGSRVFYSGIFISLIVFGSATIFSYWKPHLACSLTPILIWGLFILSLVQLLGLMTIFLIGNNIFSNYIHSVDVIYGTLLFTGFIVYDTYKAVKVYTEEKNADHLSCATCLYLDFINVLIRIMEIIAKKTK